MAEDERITSPEVSPDEAYQLARSRRERESEMAYLQSLAQPAGPAAPADGVSGAEESEGGEELPTDDRSVLQRFATHVSPLEFMGGALDAFDENFNTLRKLSEGGNKFLMESLGIPGLIIDEDGGFRFTTDADELHATDDFGGLLPDIGDKERGGMARGIGQFAANYIGLGKAFKGLGALQGTTRAAMATNATVRGAIGTFAGFEGMDNPVNHLVDAFPSIEGPVTEFFDSDAEDPELLNKLRNGLLDAGIGTAVDGAMFMLRNVRHAHKAVGQLDQIADDVARTEQIVETSREQFKQLLGDPDDARLLAMGDAASEGVEAGDDVFINWSRIDSEDDVKQLIQDLADADAPAIHSARRGVQSNELTEALADQEDAWQILLDRRKSNTPSPLNAEQSLAVRRLWTASGEKTLEMAQRVQAGGGVAEQTALRKMLAVHATIQEQVIAARTETARALQSWRIPAGGMAEFSAGLDDLMRQVDLDPATKRIAEGLTTMNAMGRTTAADAFVYAAGRMGKLERYATNASDMIRQLYYAALLSSPHTHARNGIGNTGMSILHIMERKAANSLGRMLGDAQVADGEASAMAFGMVQGARDAFRISKLSREAAEAQGRIAGTVADAVRTGDSGFGIGKVDSRMLGAFSAEKLRVDPDSAWGKALDYLDAATQIPTRGLGVADEVFKTANYRAEIAAQAHRRVQQEIAEGTITKAQGADRLATLLSDPDEAMKLMAMRQAQEATFTAVPQDTGFWRAARGVSQAPVLGKILLPFSRTPYNIMIESIERLPLAPLSKKWRADMLAGGARADIALAKTGLGSMFLAASFDLAANGYLTGDMRGLSVTPGEREQRTRLGERSMTLRIPTDDPDGSGRTFSFRGLDPLTFSLGVAANTYEILSSDDFEAYDKDGQDIAAAAIMAIGSQFTTANYMSGVSDFFDAMSNPARASEGYLERLVSSPVPTGIAQVARTIDPTFREVNTWWEAVTAKIPLASMALEPKLDVWGRELSRDSGLGSVYDLTMPIYSANQDVAPIDVELDSLGKSLGKPPRSTSFDGINVNLKAFPHIYTEYVRLSGNAMKETVEGAPVIVKSIGFVSQGGGLREELDAIVQGNHPFSGIYEAGTEGAEGDRAHFIQSITDEYRKQARRHLVEKFPDLRAELEVRSDERQERNFGPQRLNLFGN